MSACNQDVVERIFVVRRQALTAALSEDERKGVATSRLETGSEGLA
ncbi:MAG TPA: hypothetical protein VMZ66_00190 [Aeromicrobium sp.]|nr:hypothetical protein [Aeromicrobium sp.]